MSNNHTPGPWKIIDWDEDYIAITDHVQDYGVCRLEEVSSETRAVMQANARLIAACPEMFAALETALKTLRIGGHYDTALAVERALAKAEWR